MPINYEHPKPVSLSSAFGGGRGGGGGDGQVIQLQDRTGELQNRLALAGLQGNIENDQIQSRGVIAGALETHRANLDAQLYQRKLTEAEAAKMRQYQNSLAMIQDDKTLSRTEKMSLSEDLMRKLAGLESRAERDAKVAQTEMYQQHAAQFKMTANLNEERLKNAAALASGKIRTIINPAFAEKIKEIVRDSGTDPESPEGLKMIDQIGFSMPGASSTFRINDKGEVEGKPIFMAGGEGETPEGQDQSGARSSTTRTRQQDPGQMARQDHKDAMEYAQKVQASGGDAKAAYKEYMEGLRTAVGEVDTPEKRKAKIEEGKKKSLGINEVNKDELKTMPGISDIERKNAGNILNELGRLIEKYPPGSSIPPSVEKRMSDLDQAWDHFKSAVAYRMQFLPTGEAKPNTAPATQPQQSGNMAERFRDWTNRNLNVNEAAGNIMGGRLPGAGTLQEANRFTDENLNLYDLFR